MKTYLAYRKLIYETKYDTIHKKMGCGVLRLIPLPGQ